MSRTAKDAPVSVRIARAGSPEKATYSDPAKGKAARAENRRTRSRDRQAVREGRFDSIEVFVRNARWLAH